MLVIAAPVRFEQLDPLLGEGKVSPATLVGVSEPRLSWRYETLAPHASSAAMPHLGRQSAYEIEVCRANSSVETVRVDSGEQILVSWPFAPLNSRERVSVRVRGYFGTEKTPWSPSSVVEAGLLVQQDWDAQWISPSAGAAVDHAAPVLGTTFLVEEGLVEARLRISALGIVVATINGLAVSGDHFAPGWTSYEHRLRYQSYDVAALLTPGENELAALLGNGWYRGRVASFDLHRGAPYGDYLGLLAQLEITYADGRRVDVSTDTSWRAGESNILANDFYDGQFTDLRTSTFLPVAELDGNVRELPPHAALLVAPTAPPVRKTQCLPVRTLTPLSEGRTLIDFGQNLVGWVRLCVTGKRGDRVVVRHAEVLEDGELSLRPLRSAQATDTYILSGAAQEVLEPRLVFHGFRYIEVSGAMLNPADIAAVVISSDLTRTGWFETSDPAVNDLHNNVVWGMRGNFLDVPTDCPQRDERLGWTGDIQVFAPTASALFDVSGFLSSWLTTLGDDQLSDGTVPAVIPRVFRTETPYAGWGDAAVIVPWTLFERYGDLGILRRQYGSMQGWVEKVGAIAGEDLLWTQGEQLGDWLDPLAPPDAPAAAQADPGVVATAYFARSTQLLAWAAEALGYRDDALLYEERAAGIRAAFEQKYVTEDGIVFSDCQTVYAMALRWDLIADVPRRELAGRRLAALVARHQYTVATGFLGTPLILDALSDSGNIAAAYKMVVCRENPSWLYSVDMGATTVWERWDAMLPDGSVNPGVMTSFNHYAFGAIADWMHRKIAGLTPLAPGYRHVRIAPIPGGGITSSSFEHVSPYGGIGVRWTLRDGLFKLNVQLPVGVTAEVRLPNGDQHDVGQGEYEFLATDLTTAKATAATLTA
ncbi:hypothetical protein ART_3090 [Arthrobacter sp. PAMC 25486]|nr:hypothetical protein ART_3090 [Arthrobacter sp. PAMC 25486]